ncbi:MAG: Holliday junction branch migration protein RuvA [Negativicutes bacterium]|nr:Holliday junction branch migration protein RuvA [Negativicutes bacterium]
MIGYIKGIVSHVFPEFCFLDVNGVGYRIFVPESTRRTLNIGQPAILFTYLNVREDALLLYGFSRQDEYEMFMQLISITGIGPKVALTILSAVSADEFRLMVIQKNISLLTKLPGIGKKTAERIVLELKDKLAQTGASEDSPAQEVFAPAGDSSQEALQALIALGYSQAEILPVLRRLKDQGLTVEGMIKAVLKEFVRGK